MLCQYSCESKKGNMRHLRKMRQLMVQISFCIALKQGSSIYFSLLNIDK